MRTGFARPCQASWGSPGRLEVQAFSAREIGGDDDVLDFFVGHFDRAKRGGITANGDGLAQRRFDPSEQGVSSEPGGSREERTPVVCA